MGAGGETLVPATFPPTSPQGVVPDGVDEGTEGGVQVGEEVEDVHCGKCGAGRGDIRRLDDDEEDPDRGSAEEEDEDEAHDEADGPAMTVLLETPSRSLGSNARRLLSLIPPELVPMRLDEVNDGDVAEEEAEEKGEEDEAECGVENGVVVKVLTLDAEVVERVVGAHLRPIHLRHRPEAPSLVGPDLRDGHA